MRLTGIHHLTAVSANVRENYRFYTRVMGMRLVKRSVNQDDVTAYHLFYADGAGSPGTDLTFFDWPVPRERRGTHSIVRTSLRVRDGESLEWWACRLADGGVENGGIVERDGRATVDFEDPEGQRLSLVEDGGAGDEPVVWEKSAVPAEHQLRGLGPIVISVPALRPTDVVLTEVTHMRHVRDYASPDFGPGGVHVFEMGTEGDGLAGPHRELHVAVQPDLPPARQGAGAVHHVAFRTPTETEYHAWGARLNELGIPNSGEVDRYWFRSLYFREPNGILFEIATDGPGFAVDEETATLGEKVVLPPFLESRRESIVANLKPIE
ncbi:MAG TPA: ring-cleaving dioxygenase [Longimicrobiales bacterium]|nr:ring-cleaving dioxygenase [Longimicrobiales bacterium]